jgi:exopolyphosphatase / guanosine-5'-triphosphate,3'-diphosphate pyrophosphatase
VDTTQGKRFASIDIGSNAIRLLIMSAIMRNGSVKTNKMTLIRLPIRLGSDVFVHGYVREEQERTMIHALHGFSLIMKAYEVDQYKACATSAMRDAKNGDELLQHIKELAGIDVEIIDGAQEADYIFQSELNSILDKKLNYLYIDVGGGSTELTLIIKGKRQASASFQLGTVRILENKEPEEVWEQLRKWLNKHVVKNKIESAIGSGGNINKLYKLIGGKNKRILKTSDLQTIHEELAKLTYEERMQEFDLNYDRADVIIPAAQIFLAILEQCQIKQTVVPKIGLADGLIMDMIAKDTES